MKQIYYDSDCYKGLTFKNKGYPKETSIKDKGKLLTKIGIDTRLLVELIKDLKETTVELQIRGIANRRLLVLVGEIEDGYLAEYLLYFKTKLKSAGKRGRTK